MVRQRLLPLMLLCGLCLLFPGWKLVLRGYDNARLASFVARIRSADRMEASAWVGVHQWAPAGLRACKEITFTALPMPLGV